MKEVGVGVCEGSEGGSVCRKCLENIEVSFVDMYSHICPHNCYSARHCTRLFCKCLGLFCRYLDLFCGYVLTRRSLWRIFGLFCG